MGCGCAKRRAALLKKANTIKDFFNRQRGRMSDNRNDGTARAGFKSHPPVVSVEPNKKRPAEFWLNDVKSTIGRLNIQLAKCQQMGMGVTLRVERGPDGQAVVVLEGASLP